MLSFKVYTCTMALCDSCRVDAGYAVGRLMLYAARFTRERTANKSDSACFIETTGLYALTVSLAQFIHMFVLAK